MERNGSGPSALSLFAGCGGDTLGLERAGFSVPYFVEKWAPAVRTHKQNFPRSAPLGERADGDITRIPDSEFERLSGRLDLIFAGFPCQGFSHAGRKDPNDPRNRLFWEFVRAAQLARPKWIVGENVSGLLHRTTDDGVTPVGDVIVQAFEDIGYRMCPPFVLDSADFGVPQRRKRVFFVGSRAGSAFRPPSPSTRHSRVGVRDAITFSLRGALPVDPSRVEGGIGSWLEGEGQPVGPPHPYLKQKVGEDLVSFSRRVSPYHVEVVDLDRPAKTIHSGYEFQPRLFPALKTRESFFVRTFFPEELAEIQGLPRGFSLSGTAKEQIVQIGNAVPPALAAAVVKQVVRCDPDLASPLVETGGLRAWSASVPTP